MAGKGSTGRAKPGSRGEGDYYHIELRDSSEFEKFRVQDVGEEGHLQRVAGQRKDGTWDTQKWLLSKEDAHLEGDRLVPDNIDAMDLLEDLGRITRIEGDRFRAEA